MTDYGIGSFGATLAARVLGFPRFILTNRRTPVATQVFYWLEPLDPDVDPYLLGTTGALPGLRFPYGLLVEPDEPL